MVADDETREPWSPAAMRREIRADQRGERRLIVLGLLAAAITGVALVVRAMVA
ncbi:hypothetical protein [Cellulomonas sp. PhB150]|uniref:hypothetical protein n=1 Tax=Cellulomonas sp. PhB150 TaxID=2485188 RepID=UPI000FA8E258|nr:hypothetical protein [Cellulomonas sp. PhB150]ROS31687.1 hypothetical protein EDF34_1350 [Cellulomonas sp. PhB150]